MSPHAVYIQSSDGCLEGQHWAKLDVICLDPSLFRAWHFITNQAQCGLTVEIQRLWLTIS